VLIQVKLASEFTFPITKADIFYKAHPITMPELPEVETTRRGIEPYIINRRIQSIEIRESRMRWPIEECVHDLVGHKAECVERRAKYLLIRSKVGTLILHLGMSGSLRICPTGHELKKHDHFIVGLEGDMEMRLHDPRRFGAVLWHGIDDGPMMEHRLLQHLGPEPLSDRFDSDYFAASCSNRKTSIKQHIMNSKTVVGVGNIYASEALFRSGIKPTRKAGNISKPRLIRLNEQIKQVLSEAIKQGGTTLRDFLREDGQPGYFKQRLQVYDRAGKPCRDCGKSIQKIVISNRSTFYCSKCQR
jgi:formamidopyrimidine-DNA glycosylase